MAKNVSPVQKTLNLWAIILIVWSLYRAKFRTDLPITIDEFIAKPLVFVAPLYYYITQIEKKNFFTEVDLTITKRTPKDIWIGLGVGGMFLVAGAIGSYIKLHGDILQVGTKLLSVGFLITLVTAFATSFSEEVLSRGFVLKRLYEDSKNVYTSSFLASILFFFLHVPILFTSNQILGNTLLQVMVTDLLLSFVISILYLQRRSLILAILIHALYSISLYLFL